MDNLAQVEPVKRSVWRRLGLVLLLLSGLLAVAYTLVGFVLLPGLVKQSAEEYVQLNLRRELRVYNVAFNPFTFNAALNGVQLLETDGEPLLSFRSLTVKLDLKALLQGSIKLSEIKLLAPWVHLKIDREGKLNLAQLLADANKADDGAEAKAEPTAGSPIHFLIERLLIENGTIKVSDLSGSKPVVAYLVPLNIQLSEFSNQPGDNTPLNLTATTDHGGTLHWQGELSLEPFSSHGSVKLEKIKLMALWEFLRDRLNLDPPHGSIDLQTSYDFNHTAAETGLVVDGVQLKLSDLLLRRTGTSAPLLALQTVTLTDGKFELEGNRLSVGQLSLTNGNVSISKEKGQVDWQDLVKRAAEKSTTDNKQEPAGTTPDWSVQLPQLGLESVSVKFEDRDLNQPVITNIGNLELALNASAQQKEGTMAAGVNGLELTLKDISMSKAGAPDPLLLINDARLQQGKVDLASQSIRIERIALKGGNTQVVRESDGHIDWESVWQQKEQQQIANPADQSQSRTKPWRVELASLSLDQFAIALTDQSNPSPARLHLSPINLQLSGISSTLDKSIGLELKMAVNEGGKLALSGRLDAATPAAELSVKLEQLSLLPLRPYLQPVANIELKSGLVSSSGHLSYARNGQGALAYKGGVNIDDLLITEPASGETLVSWKLLEAGDFNLSLQPDGLQIKEVLLKQPAGKFVIDKERNTNWQDIFKTKKDTQTADIAATAQAQFPVSVERLQLDAGRLEFADFSLPLPFSTKVHELNGSVVGISTASGAKASSSLQGRVDEFGSASIKGDIAPFDPLLFTDMRVVFTNLNMADMTPYTAKFAGYVIDSGKLSLNLGYKIAGGKLQGENQIVLNQLKLGKKVESPDAIDAPLELAIALMQDSKGVIDLGLPIRGNLDDPEFSYGHLVVKAIGNLITKIVTAPFRMLGAIFGIKGDDLDTVTFTPGSASLAPPEQEKLLGVVKVLQERPKLTLEIQGQFDEKVDGDALKERAIRAEIGRRLGRQPAVDKEPDPISLTDSTTQSVMEALFAERISVAELEQLKSPGKSSQGATNTTTEGKSQEREKGAVSSQSTPSSVDVYEKIFQRLVDAQPLVAADFQKLASNRGEAIVQAIKKTGKLPDTRIQQMKPIQVATSTAGGVASKLNLGVGK